MQNSMGFRTQYDYEAEYTDFTNPTIMEGMSGWEDIFTKAWEDNKDKAEELAKKEFGKALDKYGQPILDDLYKEAIVTADKYLTADEQKYEESKKRLNSLTQVGSAAAFHSIKQTMADNKWIILGGTVGAMFLFGLVGYGFSRFATRR